MVGFCKIKQNIGDEYDCVLCDPQIKSLLGYDLVSPKDFQARQGFFFCFLRDKKLKGRFTLSSTIEVFGYCALKIDSKG